VDEPTKPSRPEPRLGSGAAHVLRPIAEYPSGFVTIPPFAG